MNLLIGKRACDLAESHHIVLAVDDKWALLQCIETAKCDWRRLAELTVLEPIHPKGLRPVAYQWGGRSAEYKQGWLVSISGDPDGATVIVETEDGQILELDTPAVRFMDRGQGLPAADSVPLALSV